MTIPCKLVVDDWRQTSKSDSIYESELGAELSAGDLHSGTTFDARLSLQFARNVEVELLQAMRKHGAYVTFRVLPTLVDEDVSKDPHSAFQYLYDALSDIRVLSIEASKLTGKLLQQRHVDAADRIGNIANQLVGELLKEYDRRKTVDAEQGSGI